MFSLFFFLLLLKTRKNGRIAGFPSVVYTIWKVGLSLMVADKKKREKKNFSCVVVVARSLRCRLAHTPIHALPGMIDDSQYTHSCQLG